MIKSVGIFGCSWSKNSANNLDKNTNSHDIPGNLTFTNLFNQQGIICNNYSIIGASNQIILSAIKQQDKREDLTIIFQTDPIRDLFVPNEKEFVLRDNIPAVTVNTLDEYCELLLADFYHEIDRAVPGRVLLVGGLSRLFASAVPARFNRVNRSWTELVDNEFEDCYYEWVDPTLYVFAHLNHTWKRPLSNFEAIENKILQKNHIWQTNDHFGWCHASDLGYQIMFDCLLEKIKEY